MTLRKCLTAFLILLLVSPLITLVYADPGREPIKEHPWEEIKSNVPSGIKGSDLVPYVGEIYFFLLPPSQISSFTIMVVKEKRVEVVKKELSVSKVSLPRKK